jgi:hypothetical protein
MMTAICDYVCNRGSAMFRCFLTVLSLILMLLAGVYALLQMTGYIDLNQLLPGHRDLNVPSTYCTLATLLFSSALFLFGIYRVRLLYRRMIERAELHCLFSEVTRYQESLNQPVAPQAPPGNQPPQPVAPQARIRSTNTPYGGWCDGGQRRRATAPIAARASSDRNRPLPREGYVGNSRKRCASCGPFPVSSCLKNTNASCQGCFCTRFTHVFSAAVL